MESLKLILSKYLIFVIVFAIFLVIVTILSFVYSKKENKNSIYLFGAFMNYSNKQIFALTCIIMNFILLGFFLADKLALSYALIIVSLSLIIISSLVSMGIVSMFINVLINMVNLSIVYFGNLVNNLRIEAQDTKYLYLQIAIMTAGLLFYFFTTFLFVKGIRKKELKNEKN